MTGALKGHSPLSVSSITFPEGSRTEELLVWTTTKDWLPRACLRFDRETEAEDMEFY